MGPWIINARSVICLCLRDQITETKDNNIVPPIGVDASWLPNEMCVVCNLF